MEDEKLAAYYDDLTRRGGGAARFKQGLGFSGNDDVPSRGSALPTTSSFLSSFVRASSPSKTSEFEKQAQLQSIQNKLSQKPKEKTRSRSPSRERIRDKHSKRRRRSPSPSPSRDIDSRRGSRSRSRSRDRNRDKHSKRRSSRSHSRDRYSRRRSRSRSRDRRSRRSRSREDGSRCRSRSRERSKRQGSSAERKSEKGKKQSGGGGLDFAKLIDGYDNMTPAERVKAKMKLQLSRTAENDEAIGKGSGWERFDFDKDAPLDDDEEIEAAEDDAVLVKRMGQSFRFSAVEGRKEEEMKAVHDEAMFGAPSYPPPTEADDEEEEKKCHKKRNVPSVPMTSLLSDQVLTMQKGSWRDRARKP